MSEHHPHHHHEISEKSVKYLFISFLINMLLSVVEFVGGIIAGSVSLIGDALHNTSDALSILIAVIAFKIGRKKATPKYTFGFKRAEVIGGFINLILLFISGCYLFVEGIERLFNPEPISGTIIIAVSVLALIIDAVTAKISHHGSEHNANMRMVFLHNLADAFGSIGVIISGACVLWFGVYWVDSVIAFLIATYMIFQSVISFPNIVNILMNTAPENLDMVQIEQQILSVEGVKGVHHIHLWRINEHDTALECHVVGNDLALSHKISHLMEDKFEIHHCTVQLEDQQDCPDCHL